MKAARRRSPWENAPVGNDILRALLESQYEHLRSRLQQVDLEFGEIVYRADQVIKYVYFPETAVVAMVDTMADGNTIEVGLIGREGMVGMNVFLGALTTPDKAIVQIPGTAMRMRTSDLRKETRFGSPLQRLLLRYTQTLLAVISQSVGCSQHHTVAQRLARWLLTTRQHSATNEFSMSQQFIADMLGVRRVGVSAAAAELQAAGLISYSRGRIRVLDKAGLEKKSCECYRFIRKQFDGLLRELPTFLATGKS